MNAMDPLLMQTAPTPTPAPVPVPAPTAPTPAPATVPLPAPAPVPVPPVAVQAAIQQQATELTQDMINTLAIGKRFIEAEKAGGIKAIAEEFGHDLPQLQQVAGDLIAAVPAIKSGWKTSEFWLALALMLMNAACLVKTGAVLPLEANASLGGMIAAYAGSRSYTKANAATATSSSTQSTKTETTSSAPAVQIKA